MNLYSWSCVALGNSNVSKNGASFIKTLTVALLEPPCPSDTTISWDKFSENSLPLKRGTFIESVDPLRRNAWLDGDEKLHVIELLKSASVVYLSKSISNDSPALITKLISFITGTSFTFIIWYLFDVKVVVLPTSSFDTTNTLIYLSTWLWSDAIIYSLLVDPSSLFHKRSSSDSCHWYVNVNGSVPSTSDISDVSALIVAPSLILPDIRILPVAAVSKCSNLNDRLLDASYWSTAVMVTLTGIKCVGPGVPVKVAVLSPLLTNVNHGSKGIFSGENP